MKFIKALFSIKLSVVLVFAYICICAVATYIESLHGTPAVNAVIYKTWWFNAVHIILGVNLLGSIIVNKIYKKPFSFILHFSFLVILLGAGITRFYGFEGVMHIREGETTNIINTEQEYIIIKASDGSATYTTDFKVSYTALSESRFDHQIPLFGKEVKIAFKSFTPAFLDNPPKLKLNFTYDGESREITLVQSYIDNSLRPFRIGNVEFLLIFGPKDTFLPFSIKLNDFVIDRYPGSLNPSSYASEIVVLDDKINMPYRIYMNHILDYRGYRFYQSSYDEDEKGTILSVNNDPGKNITYVGYALLILGFLWTLFSPKGRLFTLVSCLRNARELLLVAMIFGGTNFVYAYQSELPQKPQNSVLSVEIDEKELLKLLNNFKNNSKSHAKLFGSLLMQDFDGRIQPLDTMSMDFIHKITKSNSLLGLDHNQLFLGMLMYPNEFKRVKMIATSTPKLRDILGVDKDQKYLAFVDFLDGQNYKLANYLEDANRKSPSSRDKFDKDVIRVSESLDLAYAIYTAQILNIFPDVSKETNTWYAPAEAIERFPIKFSDEVAHMLQTYDAYLNKALSSNQWNEANASLEKIKTFQKQYGSALFPPELKINLEIILNSYMPFYYLIYAYILVGLIILFYALSLIIRGMPLLLANRFYKVLSFLLVVFVSIDTLALIARWYVSEHPPFSNAYESMIYIAYCGVLGAVLFFRRYPLALALASILAGVALFVANLGFMDPQITNLVPVLKSYWLNIHVSIITASYGFFGLCFFVGILTLILFALRGRYDFDLAIRQLHCVNEISMIIGLAFLSVGNFLGGVWANESWGRYWGWDPKETWALISIGVYVIVLHLRLFISRRYLYIFALASVVAFFSILMTYFGVNYFLVGKHSYAGGEAMSLPYSVIYLLVFVVLLALISVRKSDLGLYRKN